MNDQRVIVTGGSGFVGTNLVSYFKNLGWDIVSFDTCKPRNPAHNPHWIEIDLLDRSELIKKTVDLAPSVFLHFGARTDLDEKKDLAGYAQNIEGTRNVIDATRKSKSIRHIIFASSQLVCKPGYVPKDDLDYRPNTLYGRSKELAERIIRSSPEMDPNWTIVRPTSLWGPWFGPPFIELFQLIRDHHYFHIKGENPIKQWGFIGNSLYQIHKIIEAAPEDVNMQTFYLADYSPQGLHQFADEIQRSLAARPIREIPAGVLKGFGVIGDCVQKMGWKHPPLTSYRYHNLTTPEIHDLTKLERITGPLPYSQAEGIELTVAWLSSNGRITRSKSLN